MKNLLQLVHGIFNPSTNSSEKMEGSGVSSAVECSEVFHAQMFITLSIMLEKKKTFYTLLF